jgi:uncharacterized protein (TIGR02172 family)
MIDINSLTKIAAGGQAEIYDLNNGKVLRLLYKKEDKYLIDYEFKSLQIVKRNGLFVPDVFEIVDVNDRPGLIMEKIDGITMTKLFQIKPTSLFKKVKELSVIHFKLNKIKAPEGFMDLKKRIKFLVEKSSFINSEKKDFVSNILEQLPDGDKLCHGDFHPGNIIIKNNKPYIIDWCGVTKADPIADVAHTYLIFKNMPRLPNSSFVSFRIMKLAGYLASKTYLKSYNDKIDTNIFSKWLLVRAAERTFYGEPSEKQSLVRFIDKCYADFKNNRSTYNWLTYL